MNTNANTETRHEYWIFPEEWTVDDYTRDESAFADYVIETYDSNTLDEWIMNLISNVLGEYNLDRAKTVEEFKAKAEAALNDSRAR